MATTASIFACKPSTRELVSMVEILNLERYWQGLHYLLCDSAENNADVSVSILKGTKFENNSSVEAFFLHEPTQVKSYSNFLKNIHIKNIDSEYLEKEPPIQFSGQEVELDLTALIKQFEEFKKFINIEAKNGNGLLVVFS